MQVASVLVSESQLGSCLNHALKNQHRADFALLLSLLSSDVGKIDTFEFKSNNKSAIQQQLGLAGKPKLMVNLSQASYFSENGHYFPYGNTDYQLQQALNPEPLLIGGTASADMLITLENCDLATRSRFYGDKTNLECTMSCVDQLLEQLHHHNASQYE